MSPVSRRVLLSSSGIALLLLGFDGAYASIIRGTLPWKPDAGDPPEVVAPEGWKFFTPQEAASVEAFVDRLIPPDPETPGGEEAGCAIFIDRQLAGPYGRFEGYYMKGPFRKGTKEQGPQSATTPAQKYRRALASIDSVCHDKFDNKSFVDLSDEQKDDVIKGLEDGSLKLADVNSQDFFKLILKDTQYGFLADPIYGGNKDMVSWKMIGFPGAHYDYREWIDRHNQPVPLPAVGISSHPDSP